MGYILLAVAFWLAFFVLVPRAAWRSLYPEILFGALLGTISDLIGVGTFQWHYLGPTVCGLSLWADLGVAPPAAGLFIWSLGRFRRHPWSVWGFWVLGNTLGEWFFVRRGWIIYGYWHPLKAFLFYLGFFILLRLHHFFLVWLEERT
ncbi:MAG: hypothetical protein ACUVRM_06680 [Bacillota bacterium]